jgi:DNA-binding response OmpR family regulator
MTDESTNAEPKTYLITLDDDPMISKLVEKYTGITSLPFTSGEKLLTRAASLNPVAAIIDVHLNVHERGIDVLPQLREIWPFTPMIVATTDTNSKLVGEVLAAGANDFIRKPLDKEELTGRLQARMSEMRQRVEQNLLTIGNVMFNHKMRYLESEGQKIYVSPMESELLYSLIEAKGMVVSRDVLKRKLWGDLSISDNALDRRISELRKSMKGINSQFQIFSIYGTGVTLMREDARELRAKRA